MGNHNKYSGQGYNIMKLLFVLAGCFSFPFTLATDADNDSYDYSDHSEIEKRQTGYASYPVYQSYQYQPSAPAYPTYREAPVEPTYSEAPVEEVSEDTVVEVKTIPPPTFQEVVGFGLAEKIGQDTEDAKQFILTIAQNEETLPLVNELIDTNPCVSNLEGYIALVEFFGNIIEENAPELEKIFLALSSLRGERNITILTGTVSDLLLQIDEVYPNLDFETLFLKCGGSPEKGIKALRDMALIFYKMSQIEEIPFLDFNKERKDRLKNTALITEASTNVLDHFRENLAKRDCFTSKDFLGDFVYLTAETLDDLAGALGVLGYLPVARETRQYAAFTASIVSSLEKVSGFRIPDDCSSGKLLKAAKLFKDIADLFSEVGLESLAIELGVTFRLDLLP